MQSTTLPKHARQRRVKGLLSSKAAEPDGIRQEHKTSFTESLYAYLKLSRNITNTAKALNLHRNSLIYHLKRIQEILKPIYTAMIPDAYRVVLQTAGIRKRLKEKITTIFQPAFSAGSIKIKKH